MDQKRIGEFLKELRKEKGITQEAFAEILNVSGRTVSRWETGRNLPDISLLCEISAFYNVSIQEIINGERKSENMEKEINDVAQAMSDYATEEKTVLLKRVKQLSVVGLIALFTILLIQSFCMNPALPIYAAIVELLFALAMSTILLILLYTTGKLDIIARKEKNKFILVLEIICFVTIISRLVVSIIQTLQQAT